MSSEYSQPAASVDIESTSFAPLAIVGMDCRLPGANGLSAYEKLLFEGRVGFAAMPKDRLDRSLYFNARKSIPGMTYTELGGCVPDDPAALSILGLPPEQLELLDPVHLNFAAVAMRAWESAGLQRNDSRWSNAGIFVGHSGATRFGGDLNLASQIDENLDFLNDLPAFRQLARDPRRRCLRQVAAAIRSRRPKRSVDHVPRYNGYTAASLPAELLGFHGQRMICDAACASSLFAMQQAAFAIQQGRLDVAIVGGATTNGVDNLVLFSQSRACSEQGSCPFDENASGLISSEGYAAVVVMPLSTARKHKLLVHGVITGLGTSSDGKGKSLWAPRVEGQQLAIRRAYLKQAPLEIDYLEAHATSTQLGDATELHAVQSLLEKARPDKPSILIGSAKSNLGHTLETAGVAGLIKILLAMKHQQIPASLSFRKPNSEFDWSSHQIQVVDQQRAWKKSGAIARSAVSAFGIGGLNAHLWVQQSSASPAPEQADPGFPFQHSKIAIVGRGVVLPGALNLQAFAKLLQSGKSVVGPAPADRWRGNIGVSADATSKSYSTPTNHGGFIRDYVFDSEPYRIPPLQVRHSNPLQMMLLDAVSQSISELDKGQWNLDRQRAGVVIGTVFGGDFGSQLQLGLRLPEITREIANVLSSQGIRKEQIDQIIEGYRNRVLEQRPALLDETGSFTASTLASRVAKVFDLMGGACAIDADDASGLAGLNLAMDQLRSGLWDVAICGGADRTMDLMKFEQLAVQGRLVLSGKIEDIPDDCHQILPGEGVVVLMLKRLNDAIRDGNPVYGVVDDVQLKLGRDSTAVNEDAALARQIGYLSGAQSLVRIVKQSLLWENLSPDAEVSRRAMKIESLSEDGFKYAVQLSAPMNSERAVKRHHAANGSSTPCSQNQNHPNLNRDSSKTQGSEVKTERTTAIHAPIPSVATRPGAQQSVLGPGSSQSASPAKVFRFSAASPELILKSLDAAATHADEAFRLPECSFDAASVFRVGLLAESPQQLATRLRSVIKQIGAGRNAGVLETERGVLWHCQSQTGRTAWVFPGQGSQYEGIPAALQNSLAASDRLQGFDNELQAQGLAALTPELHSQASRLNEIWWNQAWVLGLSLSLLEELRAHCGPPDAVLGHSFGEYSALVASGCLTMKQAIRMVKSRANAITMTVREPGQLISVRGTPGEVSAHVRQSQFPIEITHFNAPQQTVIATAESHVEAVRQQLTAAGLASVVVAVPVAYHTSRLVQAEELLAQSFSNERFLPSRCPVLSATSARYLVEPMELRNSLVQQMTRPVLYVQAVERLLADNTNVLIEVGPNNVLSRLNQEIAGSRALCLSMDLPGRPHTERLQLLELVQQITLQLTDARKWTGHVSSAAADIGIESRRAATVTPQATASSITEIEIVDLRKLATRGRNDVPQESPVIAPKPGIKEVSPESTKEAVAKQQLTPQSLVASERGVDGPSLDEILQFLKTVVVDLTGYAPHVVDFKAELEADLGVDSIKKAQVVGEMAEQFGIDIAPTGVKLSDLSTLEEIAQLGHSQLIVMGSAASSEVVVDQSLQKDSAPVEIAIEAESEERLSGPVPVRSENFDTASIERFLIDLVVDQTGYSHSVVDLDADLEGDLGIDSIKRAQLFGEVQQQFEIQTPTTERTAIGRFNTLRSILTFLVDELTQRTEPEIEVSKPLPSVAPHQNTLKKKPASRLKEATQSDPEPLSMFSRNSLPPTGLRGWPLVDSLPEEWREPFLVTGMIKDGNARQRGKKRGEEFQEQVRAALQLIQDHGRNVPVQVEFSSDIDDELAGLAAGACVNLESVRTAYQHLIADQSQSATSAPSRSSHQTIPSSDLSGHVAPHGTGSRRFALRIVPAPQRAEMPKLPVLTGPGLVLGNNDVAREIVQRFSEAGQSCLTLPDIGSLAELDHILEKIWQTDITPHLFITTSYDDAALREVDATDWKSRRFDALEVPYRVCQKWMQRTIDEQRMDGASVVICTRQGGDFGFSGGTSESPEGGLAGLVKAMLIECWMRGFRATPMKVIDFSPETTPDQAVDGMCAELAVPSYDMEVAYHGAERWTVQPIHVPLFPDHELRPVPKNGHALIRRGGVWVVTGGARGITSHVVRELAKRHHLKLHLIGTAPVPEVTQEMKNDAVHNRLNLRREVMRQANLRDQNGMEAWRNVEKSIEIAQTLQTMQEEGITATYHSCDVSRLDDLNATLRKIRHSDGKIDGIIHGAGIGQDARFDRKRGDKVDQCLRAKIDGCINLMDATSEDRLDWFVCFGSISGRFGANGHTDYSLANDSLAKLVGKYRQARPEVRSVTFHWHAWGDIGMATKPETKLALEMINMEFMPAKEGLAHFLHELEYGGNEPEVLITDLAYVRKFYPVDRLLAGEAHRQRERSTLPMLDPDNQGLRGSGPVAVSLHPTRERFLNQHLVQQKPTLPFVIALELLCEATRLQARKQYVTEVRSLKALQAIKWSNAEPLDVRVHSERETQGRFRCWLTADVKRRDGRLVASDKTYFEGEFHTAEAPLQRRLHRPDLTNLAWEPIAYLPPEAAVYHGPDLQCLQQFAVRDQEAFGLISAASTVQLGGGSRPCYGWSIAPAVMDACLYAAALFAGRQFERASLPVSFEKILIGRMADPGETPVVQIRVEKEITSGLLLSFQLIGLNGDLLLDVQGYQIGWLD